MIFNKTFNYYEKICGFCTIYIVFFVIFFIKIISISIVFVYFHWYVKKKYIETKNY